MQTEISPEMEALKSRMRAVWMAGDFGVIARSVANAADDFVAGLPVVAGMDVLDVACGTGNTAIPEAKLGANVTGIDFASNLIEQAIARAAAEGVNAKFEVGDAEDMPYPDASFDIVATMFGAMFAPRPEVTASELKRVCRPGGLIAMANWTPEAFTGMMFRTGAKHVPPPQGLPSPLMWGSEDVVRERFAAGISNLKLERRKTMFRFDMPPADVVEHFRKYFGPTQKAFESLDEAGQAALRADLTALWSEHNQATDGTTQVESEYLEVHATRA